MKAKALVAIVVILAIVGLIIGLTQDRHEPLGF